MRNIWLDGIMGVIVGDALGLPVQFLIRSEVAENPVTTMRGYGTFHLPEGTWSDDGSLTLATLESIRENKGIDLQDIMENFADWLLDGKFTPFGKAFDQGLTCVKAITNYIRTKDTRHCGATGARSNGNGALMRIMPVCLYAYEMVHKGTWTDEQAIEAVHEVSALTHNHLRSQIACGIYYFIVQAILDEEGSLKERMQTGIRNAIVFYRGEFSNLTQLSYYERIFDLDEFEKVPYEEIRSTGYVVDSLEAAVWSFLTTDSFEEAAVCAVNLGDDTDTIGAITCGLAGLYYGYEGIPSDWLEKIQGREKIEEMCEEAIA